MNFLEICKARYATKKFTGEKIEQNKVETLLEMIRLSASSFGLQPWKVHIVTNQKIKDQLQKASWDQPQIGTASHVLVFCANTDVAGQIDKMEKMVSNPGYIKMMRDWLTTKDVTAQKVWATNQAYIAMSNALNGAKELGFDSCPMEGFDPDSYKKILNLSQSLIPVVVVPIGIAADQARPKIRYPKTDLFF